MKYRNQRGNIPTIALVVAVTETPVAARNEALRAVNEKPVIPLSVARNAVIENPVIRRSFPLSPPLGLSSESISFSMPDWLSIPPLVDKNKLVELDFVAHANGKIFAAAVCLREGETLDLDPRAAAVHWNLLAGVHGLNLLHVPEVGNRW